MKSSTYQGNTATGGAGGAGGSGGSFGLLINSDPAPANISPGVGAGTGGQMVVRELQLNPNLGARAIGFVDDDPRKRGMGMLGLKVLGTTKEIARLLQTASGRDFGAFFDAYYWGVEMPKD